MWASSLIFLDQHSHINVNNSNDRRIIGYFAMFFLGKKHIIAKNIINDTSKANI